MSINAKLEEDLVSEARVINEFAVLNDFYVRIVVGMISKEPATTRNRLPNFLVHKVML
jgi:hypothetical protein